MTRASEISLTELAVYDDNNEVKDLHMRFRLFRFINRGK